MVDSSPSTFAHFDKADFVPIHRDENIFMETFPHKQHPFRLAQLFFSTETIKQFNGLWLKHLAENRAPLHLVEKRNPTHLGKTHAGDV